MPDSVPRGPGGLRVGFGWPFPRGSGGIAGFHPKSSKSRGGYLDSLKLQKHAALVLTDSGGIQEETTVLGVPCLTMRNNTERPVTVEVGTNTLVGVDSDWIVEATEAVLEGRYKTGRVPEFCDGRSAERIVGVFRQFSER